LGRPDSHTALGPAPSPSTRETISPLPSLSASPTPSATPSALPSAHPGNLADMSAALLAEAHQLLPTARFDPVPVGGFPDGNPSRSRFLLAPNGVGYDAASAQILVPPSTVGTSVLLMFPGSSSHKAPSTGCDNAYQPMLLCENRTGPAGERIWIEAGNYQGTPG